MKWPLQHTTMDYSSARKQFIQTPCDVLTEMCGVLYHAGSTPATVLTKEYSLRGPAIHFAKI
jgi:hypothetical protein